MWLNLEEQIAPLPVINNVFDEKAVIRFIGTVLDRTERRKTQDALIEAERLATTGRLAASIAHEIRNPLSAVLNLLYLIRTEPSESERASYIQRAETEINRVSEIASNTLRFYQDPSGSTTFDVGEVVQSALVLLRGRILKSQVRTEIKIPGGILVSAIQGEVATDDRQPDRECLGCDA